MIPSIFDYVHLPGTDRAVPDLHRRLGEPASHSHVIYRSVPCRSDWQARATPVPGAGSAGATAPAVAVHEIADPDQVV
jgi:hypothetical protein